MDAWIIILLGLALLFVTTAGGNGKRLIGLFVRIVGIILIGYGVNEYIQGAI